MHTRSCAPYSAVPLVSSGPTSLFCGLVCCRHLAASGRRRRQLADAPSHAWMHTHTQPAGGGCGRLGTAGDGLGGGRRVGKLILLATVGLRQKKIAPYPFWPLGIINDLARIFQGTLGDALTPASKIIFPFNISILFILWNWALYLGFDSYISC